MDETFNNTEVVFLEESDFDKYGTLAVKMGKPILVGILSSGCPWCHRVAPELIKLAKSKGLIVAVVIADENPLGGQLLQRIGKSGVPTFILFRDSALAGVYDGPREAKHLERFAIA